MEGLEDKPLYALEEQLARQRSIIANSKLLRNLPDKGAKVRESVLILQAEIQKRREATVRKNPNIPSSDVGKMEWIFANSSKNSVKCASVSSKNELTSSDKDKYEGEEDVLRIVATSQISQRQPKTINLDHACNYSEAFDSGKSDDTKLDKYVARLVNVDSKKPLKEKYVPGKSLKSKKDVSSSVANNSSTLESSGSGSDSSTPRKNDNKWAECLLPPSYNLEAVKFLPLDESIKVSEEKYKKEEEITVALSAPHKKYAYDRLKEQGLLGTYGVEMQVSRPVRPDAEDDDDLIEDDLSDDHITDDEDSVVDADEWRRTQLENNKTTSKDLSKLLNSSLKLK